MKNLDSNLNKEKIIQDLQKQDCFSLGDFAIKIHYDESPDSPRNWDNLGKMGCFHRKYDLGDKHNFANYSEFADFLFKNKPELIILPIYIYDHSGLTIATVPFHCPWDSEQIGYIYVKKNQENLSEEQIKQILINEVATYDQYLTGEVFAFEILKNDQFVDGVCGYYDKMNCINEAINSFEGVFIKKPPQTNQLSLF
ncbi:MAG: hypothetical protein ACJAZX_001060 [Rickettsiales bacterium]|jgi:hypothetical protein